MLHIYTLLYQRTPLIEQMKTVLILETISGHKLKSEFTFNLLSKRAYLNPCLLVFFTLQYLFAYLNRSYSSLVRIFLDLIYNKS